MESVFQRHRFFTLGNQGQNLMLLLICMYLRQHHRGGKTVWMPHLQDVTTTYSSDANPRGTYRTTQPMQKCCQGGSGRIYCRWISPARKLCQDQPAGRTAYAFVLYVVHRSCLTDVRFLYNKDDANLYKVLTRHEAATTHWILFSARFLCSVRWYNVIDDFMMCSDSFTSNLRPDCHNEDSARSISKHASAHRK